MSTTISLGLVPIRNFAVVDETKGIYRSAQPQFAYEYTWLKKQLNLNKIINLRSELNHDQWFGPKNGIQVVTFAVPDHHIPTLEEANQFIELIKQNTNILFHCEHGRGRTSLFCVLARLALGWTLEAALAEEKDEYGYEFQHPCQLEFLKENFSNYKTQLA